MIKFTVVGDPQTAGSKRAFALKRKDGTLVTRPNGSPIINVTDDNAKSKGWQRGVAWMARKTVGAMDLLTGPLRVTFTFYRPRPKGHFGKTGLNSAGRTTPYPITKPDTTKLVRAAEDALTGVIWRDDSQLVDQHNRKFWGEPARLEVEIEEIPILEAQPELMNIPRRMPAPPRPIAEDQNPF